MGKIKIGIIGLGGIGRRFLSEMQEHDSFMVMAAWDPSKTACTKAVTECPSALTITENADHIFSDSEINTIYIASPPQSHCDYILSAIDAGKAIYCEKPLGIDLLKSREVAGKVAESGLPNIVNFNHGRALSSCLVEEQIQAGGVGEISGVDAFVHLSRWPRDFQENATWLSRREAGGFTREILSHWIYLTRRLLGPGQLVYKNVCYPPDGVSAETSLTAELNFSGVPFIIKAACGGVGPVGTEYTIWGEKKSFRLQSGGRFFTASNGEWQDEFAGISAPAHKDQIRTLDGVAACIAGEPGLMPTVADALAVQELVEEILR